ncbi:glycosyltransferase family 2 protein [Rhodobaculum claviforme]|nr:glycosyltransferase family 2 protein [Rhodobaculum claviforme]
MTSAHVAPVAVIIVNYATAPLTIEAVDSVLARHHDGLPVEVHVIDNASPGDDARILSQAHVARGWAGTVTLHLEETNHGFGRGNNVVLQTLARREDPPDKVLLLNPDARLDNEALAILARFLDDHPRAGAAGARIERPGDGTVTSAFRFPGLASEFSGAVAFGPVDRLLGRPRVALEPGLPTQQVDWVSGAALMLRMRTLAEVGSFDPDFFLYYEEVELMFRIRRAGWEVWQVDEAAVIHHEGAATGVQSRQRTLPPRPDYWYDSFGLYVRKTRGRSGALAMTLARIAGWALNRPIAAVLRRPAAAPPGAFGAMWRRVLRPLVGLPPTQARR